MVTKKKEAELPKMGRPKLPDGLKRVRLVCTVDPKTLEVFQGMVGPGGNIGRVLDELAKLA